MSLLSVEDLTVHFQVRHGLGKKSIDIVHAVDDVTRSRSTPGETLALVGESGSGKTTVARAVLQLVKPTSGRIVFQDSGHRRADARRKRARSCATRRSCSRIRIRR